MTLPPPLFRYAEQVAGADSAHVAPVGRKPKSTASVPREQHARATAPTAALTDEVFDV